MIVSLDNPPPSLRDALLTLMDKAQDEASQDPNFMTLSEPIGFNIHHPTEAQLARNKNTKTQAILSIYTKMAEPEEAVQKRVLVWQKAHIKKEKEKARRQNAVKIAKAAAEARATEYITNLVQQYPEIARKVLNAHEVAASIKKAK